MIAIRWARPAPDHNFHAIASVTGGSYVTRCKMRWSVMEPGHAEHAQPCASEICEACCSKVIAGRAIERGLKELAANAPDDLAIDVAPASSVDARFDVSQIDDADDGIGAQVDEWDDGRGGE